MNATVIIAIIAVVVAAIPLYYMARSNARETARQRLEATGKAIAGVAEPLQRKLDELRLENRELRQQMRDQEREAQQTIRDRDRRIEQLEDELRRKP